MSSLKLLNRKIFTPQGNRDAVSIIRDLAKNLNSTYIDLPEKKIFTYKSVISNTSGSSISSTFEIYHDLKSIPKRVLLDYFMMKNSSGDPVNHNAIQFVIREMQLDRVIIFLNVTSSTNNVKGEFSISVE